MPKIALNSITGVPKGKIVKALHKLIIRALALMGFSLRPSNPLTPSLPLYLPKLARSLKIGDAQ